MIINLSSESPGTHWVCYIKRGNTMYYYDSFGNLKPSKEIVRHAGPNIKILYNYQRDQKYSSVNCGHLCVRFILDKTKELFPDRYQ